MIAQLAVVLLLSIERVPLGPHYHNFLEYKERRWTAVSGLVLLLLISNLRSIQNSFSIDIVITSPIDRTAPLLARRLDGLNFKFRRASFPSISDASTGSVWVAGRVFLLLSRGLTRLPTPNARLSSLIDWSS